MLKIYNMNKIIVVLFLFSISFSFAQNSKKDEVITKITTSLCECTSKGKIKKDNVKVGLGICLIEAMNSHKTELLKAYKTNKINIYYEYQYYQYNYIYYLKFYNR